MPPDVAAIHPASDEVVPVMLHSAGGHVPSSFRERDVQPEGDVAELGALELVDGAGVAWSHRVGRYPATLRHALRDGVDCQMPLCLGDYNAAMMRVPGQQPTSQLAVVPSSSQARWKATLSQEGSRR